MQFPFFDTLTSIPNRRPYPSYDRWAIFIETTASVLAISASMILGLLSFSGMLAISPWLSLAFAGFFFAIVIEGEIYLQNIRSALEKLFDPKAYEHQLTALYLVDKLANYDKNRDLFLLREPNANDQRRVCEHNEVLAFKQGDHYVLGFRKKVGENKYEYVQRELDKDQGKFLDHYARKQQYMEIPGHHDLIQTLLKSFDEDVAERPQEQYPLLIHAYVSQLRHLRKLNCYLHTQVANEASQNELKNMDLHLTKLAEDMSDALFHDAPPRGSVAAKISFDMPLTKKNYNLDLETMTLKTNESSEPKPQVLLTFGKSNKELSSPALLDLQLMADDGPLLVDLAKKTYDFHHNKLIEWVIADKAAWKQHLTAHTMYSRAAFIIAAFSGLIMGIGTTYLIMEAVAVIPWLVVIPLGLFPPVIGPLALIAGIAYGLLIYNSLTDMLLDNPIKKFVDRFQSLASQEMTFKRGLILGLSLVLFSAALFLAVCSAGTWWTVFHKTKPLFTLISLIPNLLLNILIPILIGISILPFSLQSVSNTLEGLEANPNLDRAINALNPWNWQAPTGRLPRTWDEASAWLSEKMWQHWVPDFLGITAAEFALETYEQKINPYRIIYQLFFEPLRKFIFAGHLASAGATQDQIENVPVWVSFWINFLFEGVEDWDWIWGRAHVDDIDTVDLVKERAQNSDDHNHDKNVPMRLLKALFEPILQRAAKWDNDHRNIERGDEDNVQKRYEKLQGLKPQAPKPEIPSYRKGSNFNLFLFKSSMLESSASLRDDCCTPQLAM